MGKGQETETPSRIQNLFKANKEFTEELFQENQNLKLLIAKLKTEIKDLERHTTKGTVAHLEQKVALLTEENDELSKQNQEFRERFNNIEEEYHEHGERFLKIEKQKTELINMYVALHNLHSTIDYDRVVSALKEIVINLIGSELFGIYLLDAETEQASILAGEGLEEGVPNTIDLRSGYALEIVKSGRAKVGIHGSGRLDTEIPTPIACIPLKVGDQVIGLVSIYELLAQKASFEEVDFALFELLGTHAGTAIFSSRYIKEKEELSVAKDSQ
jgi:hypothetical protein